MDFVDGQGEKEKRRFAVKLKKTSLKLFIKKKNARFFQTGIKVKIILLIFRFFKAFAAKNRSVALRLEGYNRFAAAV